MEPRALTVRELGAYLSQRFAEDLLLRHVWLRGELSEIKRHPSGHTYFSLSEGECRLGGVLFRGDAFRQIAWPQAGDEVLVEGRVGVYEARGIYQVYALRILPLGKGALLRARRELQTLLEREGLLDPRHKRPFPRFPSTVAVVTSPSGAAVRDVIEVGGKRFPSCRFFVVPALVQGLDAPDSLVQALQRARSVPGVEAVLLVRGGGPREDLSPFDDEHVVRAVRQCPVPVMTGIGHQTDATFCDLVADGSAPTPSAAVEKLLPSRAELQRSLNDIARRGYAMTFRRLEKHDAALDLLGRRSQGAMSALESHAAGVVSHLGQRYGDGVRRILAAAETACENFEGRLEALSPWRILERGFPACTDEEGRSVRWGSALAVGDRLQLRFVDRVATVRVEALVHPSEIEARTRGNDG